MSKARTILRISIYNEIYSLKEFDADDIKEKLDAYLNDIEILDKNQKKELKEKIYDIQIASLIRSLSDEENAEILLKQKKTEWIKKDDYDYIIKIARNITESEKLNRKNKEIRTNLDKILAGVELNDEKPERITDEDWQKLRQIESQMLIQKENIEKEKNRVLPLKDKIERQLSIINQIFEDPDSIERIEDYSNPFARGNFEKLKMISKLIKKL